MASGKKVSTVDAEIQRELQSRANYSMEVLGRAFVRNGAGSFLNIRRIESPIRRGKAKS